MMRPAPPAARGAPWRSERPAGGGHRLVAALEDVEQLPALRDAKAQLVDMLAGEDPPLAEVVLLIETDPALTLAVLREARVPELPAAVRKLGWPRLQALVEALPTFDFFDRSRLLAREAARLRVHGIAVQRVVQQIRDELELGVSNPLVVAALLHDIGKVVLASAYDRYEATLDAAEPPEERVRIERTTLGVDHAAAGALFLRRLELADEVVAAVEQHHEADAAGDAAVVKTADALAHYAAGRPIDPRQLTRAAEHAGLSAPTLRRLLQHPQPASRGRRAQLEPCPLTERQIEAIKKLRAGKSYREIAAEFGTSASTVRSHLHRAYATLGVGDRAQAVLLASKRGWI
jgi:putative nucleotidyltransferase with HDIG domain